MNPSKSFTRLAVCVTAAGLFAWASPSEAYRMLQNTSTGRVSAGNLVTCNDAGGFTHWNTRGVRWYHNTSGQGAGKEVALKNAMASWTKVTTTNHVVTYAGTTSAGFSTDGLNTISWGTGAGCSGSCLALTALVLQSGQAIVETDITFNSAYTWNTNGSNYDTEGTAAHELGHTLGIHHSEFSTSTMYATYFGTGERSLEADDKSAITCSANRYSATAVCVPDGGVDDTLGQTSCCSGYAVENVTVCDNPADYNNGWASCNQICGTVPVNGCIPSGGIDDTLSRTSCCSGAAVPGSTWCLNPADYNNGWSSCIQTCQ